MKALYLFIMSALLPCLCLAQKGDYKAMLSKVEINGNVLGYDKSIKVDSVKNKHMFYNTYNDESIELLIYNLSSYFSFELSNKSKSTIKVLWDDAAYIDAQGNTNKVLHNGVKFIDRNSSQPATSIISGAKLSDIIAPTNGVSYVSRSLSGWQQNYLFPEPRKKEAPIYEGKQVKILLPLSINNAVHEYIFTFAIKWVVEVKKKIIIPAIPEHR